MSLENELTSKLEKLEKEMGDLIYTISHDLNAPVRAISSLADWIQEDYSDVLGKDGKEQLSLLVSRTKQLHKMIEGLLLLSRAGRNGAEIREEDIGDLISRLVLEFKDNNNLTIEFPTGLPKIFCKRADIEQVFRELFKNASEHNKDKPVNLSVSAEESESDWVFDIHDNGRGIPEVDQERVFKIFQRLKAREEHDGIGMGLPIVKKIIENHGGDIRFEKNLNGAHVRIRLPKI